MRRVLVVQDALDHKRFAAVSCLDCCEMVVCSGTPHCRLGESRRLICTSIFPIGVFAGDVVRLPLALTLKTHTLPSRPLALFEVRGVHFSALNLLVSALRRVGMATHECCFFCWQVLLALEHLHKHCVIYRDLKPENVLLDSQGECIWALPDLNRSSRSAAVSVDLP